MDKTECRTSQINAGMHVYLKMSYVILYRETSLTVT